MALGTAATIAAGATALGGAIAGSRKSPGTQMQSSYRKAGADEKALQQQALQQYLQQIQASNQFEQGIDDLSPLRQQALSGYEQLLSGEALQASPEELQQIEQLRQAQVQLGTQDINRLLGDAQAQTQNLAGVRNLRGQALGSLQAQNTQQAAQQIGNVVNTAGAQAAQQAIENPFRRVAAQSQALNTGLTYQDTLRQQAVQNRQLASNPGLLSYYQQGRGLSATTPSSGGGIMGGFQGALGGAAAGIGLGSQVQGLLNKKPV